MAAARRVFLVHGFFTALLGSVSTLYALYRIQVAELTPLQLVVLGTAMEATVFLFEVPTGVVADVVSRKRSIVIGVAIGGLAWLLEASWASFWPILVSQALSGLGWTFLSGATSAWLAGEIGEERLRETFLRAGQVRRLGALVGLPIGIGLASVSLRLPLLVTGAGLVVLAVWLLVVMPETGFEPTTGRRHDLGAFAETLRAGLAVVRDNRTLSTIALALFVAGGASEAFDRLWEAHILQDAGLPDGVDPVAAFGALKATSLVLGIALIQPMRKRLRDADHVVLSRVILLLSGLHAVALVGFAASDALVLAAATWLIATMSRSLRDPLLESWIVPMVPQHVRATGLSAIGQADAIGQTLVGPGFGVVASRVSVVAALSAGAAVQALEVPVLARARRTPQPIET